MFDRVRLAGHAALQSHGELIAALRDYHKHSVQDRLPRSDVVLLQQLIHARIDSAAAFEVLIRHDATAAIEVLLQAYLSRNADPQRGISGAMAELSTMLSDVVSIRGEQSLRSLIDDPQFDGRLLDEPWFLKCLGLALKVDPEQAAERLRSRS